MKEKSIRSRFVFKVIVLLVSVVFAGTVFGSGQEEFTQQQTDQIEKIVHNYLVKNPEVLIEVSKVLQQKELQREKEIGIIATRKYAKDLINNPHSPVLGDVKGDVTLIEFFDYYCAHCREMFSEVNHLVEANPHLRVVLKEWPIFGEPSFYASRVALAANAQGKYLGVHDALMQMRQALTEKYVKDLAEELHLNYDQLEKGMKSPLVMQEQKNNYDLAKALGLIGTPAFIIVPTDLSLVAKAPISFIPGTTSAMDLQLSINSIKRFLKEK